MLFETRYKVITAGGMILKIYTIVYILKILWLFSMFYLLEHGAYKKYNTVPVCVLKWP